MSSRPKLTPPAQVPAPAQSPFAADRRASRLKLWFVLAFLCLMVVAGGVVVLLPQHLADDAAPLTQVETPQAQPIDRIQDATDRPDQGPVDPARSRAEQLLESALRQQAALEAEGVKIWGAWVHVTSYPDVLAKLAEADAHFSAQRYAASATAYEETIGLMQQLQSSRPQRARIAMQSGLEALESFDVAAASMNFEMVLALDPADAAAARGLDRTRQLPRIKQLVADGHSAEAQGDLQRARQRYAAAVDIDSELQVTRRHLDRVDDQLRARHYDQAILQATSALERGDLVAADDALQRARKLRPESAEVRDLGQRLRGQQRQVELARLRSLAESQARNENWSAAKRTYQRALAIDPQAAFARTGRQRAERYAAAHAGVDAHLANPGGLQSEDTRASAREAWRRAGQLDAGQRLRDKTDRLGDLIAAYEKPAPVVLRSDGLTDVVLYRVGKLGRFKEQRRELRPGQYTILGTRSGYRDVKIRFEVPVDGGVTNVSVVCQEPV